MDLQYLNYFYIYFPIIIKLTAIFCVMINNVYTKPERTIHIDKAYVNHFKC